MNTLKTNKKTKKNEFKKRDFNFLEKFKSENQNLFTDTDNTEKGKIEKELELETLIKNKLEKENLFRNKTKNLFLKLKRNLCINSKKVRSKNFNLLLKEDKKFLEKIIKILIFILKLKEE